MTTENTCNLVKQALSTRKFTSSETILRQTGLTSEVVVSTLTTLEAAGLVMSCDKGFKLAPVPSTVRGEGYRSRQILAKRTRKEFYVTDDEHDKLTTYLGGLRNV